MSNTTFTGSQGLGMLGLFLALGLIIAAFIVGGTLENIKDSNKTIRVKGYAEKDIVSDLGSWTGNISNTANELQTAYDILERNRDKVVGYLIQNGIKKEDILFTSINTSKNYRLNEKGYSTNIVDSYTLYQNVSITSENVELIQKIANESTGLIREGVEINSYMPKFFFTKLNDLKIEMLGKATEDAKKRAEVMADMSDSSVGKLASAVQGVFQITPQNSTEVSDWGEYNTTTINKTVKAVVTIEFAID